MNSNQKRAIERAISHTQSKDAQYLARRVAAANPDLQPPVTKAECKKVLDEQKAKRGS
jgi:hypothetical protein